MPVASLPGVAQVEHLRGASSRPDTPPSLLVEVPHGADQAAHYAACRERLCGEFPKDLQHFFFVNTDVAAWDLGVAAARAYLQARPQEVALLVRCLVPRTFVDTNRTLGGDGSAPAGKAAVTPGLAPYVHDPADQALLRGLHEAYVALTDAAYEAVVGRGEGLALVPHTYAPRTVGISAVDETIVEQLHRVYAPEVFPTWPLRAEVDLITQDGDGRRLSPPGAVEALLPALADAGLTAEENHTYWLHPATRAAALSARYPGRLLCLEVRRDLVVESWTPFGPMRADPVRVCRIGDAVGGVLAGCS